MDTERFISDVVSLQPMMQRVVVRFLHDDDLAADAVQEALIQLWHKRWRLGMMKDCRSYCMRTLRNRCIDILRQHSHDSIPLEEADRFPLQDDDAEATEERYQLLEEAIATLPPQQQQLIELLNKALKTLLHFARKPELKYEGNQFQNIHTSIPFLEFLSQILF